MLHRVIGSGDTLDGKVVSYVSFMPSGRDGNKLAFTVQLPGHAPPVDYDQGVYIVTLPTPPSALIPFAGAALWAANRRR